MNWKNHLIFAVSVCLIFLPFNLINVASIVLFSLIFSVLIDYDHKLNKKAPWYHKRTWVQEPFGFVIIGLPLALILSAINKNFFILVSISYVSHIFLDYLCIYETCPLAPFSNIKKREGLGIFVPDSKKWLKRVKRKKMKGVSENYFLFFNLILLAILILFKLNALEF